jgi:hypothetical protein
MMPRTANRILNEDALGKRTMIVRAVSIDGEDLTTSTNKQHLLLVNVADDTATIRDVLECNAKR